MQNILHLVCQKLFVFTLKYCQILGANCQELLWILLMRIEADRLLCVIDAGMAFYKLLFPSFEDQWWLEAFLT